MRVRTVMPPTPGHDFNDVLIERWRAAVTDDPQLVIDETKPAASHRQRAALPRTTARKVLRQHAREDHDAGAGMARGLERSQSPRIAKTRPTTPSR